MKRIVLITLAAMALSSCSSPKEPASKVSFDTLIMGIRDSQAIRQLFNIPESETVMAVISLGYRAGEPVRPSRRDLDEIAKFF